MSPFDRRKVELGLTFPLSRTMETHFDGFGFNPRSPQTESMTPKAFWWSLWDSVMTVMSLTNAFASLCSWPMACLGSSAFGGLAISPWIVHNTSRFSWPGSIVQIVDLHTLTCHQDIVRGFSRQVDSWRLFHGTNQQVWLIQAHPIRCEQMHP